MPNESKPSGEKVTGLLSGRFHQARIRLTLIYVAILAIILFLSSGTIYSIFSTRLDNRFARFHPHPEIVYPEGIVPPSPAEVQADLINTLLIVNGLLLLAAGLSSYWLAGITLEPIQAAYDKQRRFLSDASHELRTPLAILQTDLENELASSSSGNSSREPAESHLEEVGRMSRIVGDLLALSRLDENGDAHHETTVLNLADVINETVERLQPIAKRQGIIVGHEHAGETISVLANKELLVRALSNVVKNAIAYNKEGGSVAIATKIEGKQSIISITDTGIGIAKEEINKIFNRFYRTDESRTRQTGGSGLGLAIVKSIMKQMNGSVRIESVVGNGTTVTLRIPLSKAS